MERSRGFRPSGAGPKSFAENFNESKLVAPTGFEPVFGRGRVFASFSSQFQDAERSKSKRDQNTQG